MISHIAVPTRRLLLLLGALATMTCVSPYARAQQRRISLEQVEMMFANMRARAPWNVDEPLLWGYFFFDPEESKLRKAAAELASAGYRIVSVERVERRPVFRLHVERVEAHTPSTLNVRNGQFYELAARYGIASYDGMDVGPAPKPN
jgi:hypothetical protein